MDKFASGSGISADRLNGLAESAEAISALSVGGGLHLSTTAGVPTLTMGRTRPFFVKITGGSGGKYSWAEVWLSGTTWTTLTGGRSGSTSVLPACELNGSTTIAANTIVELHASPRGLWYWFEVPRWGNKPPCLLTVRVTKCCGAVAAGVTVTLADHTGTTVATCTTGSDGTCSMTYAGNDTYTLSAGITGCGPVTQTFTASPCAVVQMTLAMCDFPHSTLSCSLTIVTPQIDINGNVVSMSPCSSNPLADFNDNVFLGTPCCSTQNVSASLSYLGLLPCFNSAGVNTGNVPTWRSAILSGVTIPVAIAHGPGITPTFECFPVCAINLSCGCGPQFSLMLGTTGAYPCGSIDNTKTDVATKPLFHGAGGSTCVPLLLNFAHSPDSISSFGGLFCLDNSTATVS